MQIKRSKIKWGYGDIQKISQRFKEQEGCTLTDLAIRNILMFCSDSPHATTVRNIAMNELNLPIVEETIEV